MKRQNNRPLNKIASLLILMVPILSGLKISTVYADEVSFDTDLVGITYALADSDQDGIVNAQDNCPLARNVSQLDQDVDGIGDRCDSLLNEVSLNDSRLSPMQSNVANGTTARSRIAANAWVLK